MAAHLVICALAHLGIDAVHEQIGGSLPDQTNIISLYDMRQLTVELSGLM